MDGFLVKDTLTVLTQNGECHIQLCLGDITKLKHKDKVDVILISAFQGDYSPTPTSVIGALLRNLAINVRELSRDKEEDLRSLYHCWWSKPLPADKPFNRLLCFETRIFGSRRPQELVGDVFRCLVPILNNKDGTVITPLLNTGDQGFGRVVMLQGMVEAAVNWMKAGLPLRVLKIVLYCRSTDIQAIERFKDHQFMNIFKSFEKLKECYTMKDFIPQEVIIKFDVYLSFSKHDTEIVSLITEKLHSNKSDIRIFDSNQKMNVESVWQEDMYEVMLHSARIITVLTPNYLQCTSCIEQYNIAMCCSRKAMRNILAPFYVEESPLPSYMTQVQYVDCRSSEKIGQACLQVVISLSVTLKATAQMNPTIKYDVFISYSHADNERANHIVETLKRLNPELRLFFDIEELKTGTAWQRTLYHSIDGSKVMLALISNKYLSSAVCQEEYNLALAKHCSESASLKLVPLCIEDIHGVNPEFTKVKMLDAKGANFKQAVTTTCLAIVNWVAEKNMDADIKQVFEHNKDMTVNTDAVTENLRRVHFKMQYGNETTLLKKNVIFPAQLPVSMPESLKIDSSDEDQASKCDVAFSYAIEDKKYALYLAALLSKVKGITVKMEMLSDHERFALIDKAQHIIAILSPHYIHSMEKCEEFNIALSRQRMSTGRILFPVQIHVLPQQPTYFHLVPCNISAADTVWPELCTNLKIDTPLYVLDKHYLNNISRPSELALHEAAYQILQEIKKQRMSSTPSSGQVKASPTLWNVKKLQHQVDHAFLDITDDVGQYLLPPLLNGTDDIAENTSTNSGAENQLACTNHSDVGLIREGGKDSEANTKDTAQNVELAISCAITEDNSNEQQVLSGLQPTATDVPAQEQHANTGSNQPDTCNKEAVVTCGRDAVHLSAHTAIKSNEGRGNNGESSQSDVVRVDENTVSKKKGSASCTVV